MVNGFAYFLLLIIGDPFFGTLPDKSLAVKIQSEGSTMSEFELLILFNEYFDATFARLNDFMAGTFAMLISAYFAAAKMAPRLAGLLVFLYSVFATATIVPVLMAANRFARAGELLENASSAPGSIIGKLFPIFPSAVVIVPTMAILLLGAFAGTLAFFFHARKSGSEGSQE